MAKKPKPEPEPEKKTKRKNQTPAEEAPADTKPTRGIAVGDNFGWTGKLPLTLLYEHCQRNKWQKPIVNTKQEGNYITTIYLMWENPKTREMIKLRYKPDEYKFSANESKHHCATYVLHRLNFKKNMKMVLPVVFRTYWDELELQRQDLLKQNKQKHDVLFADNPFLAYMQEMDRKAKMKEKQQAAKSEKPAVKAVSLGELRAMSKSIKEVSDVATFLKKFWELSPLFDLNSDLRVKIEELIKYSIRWEKDDSKSINKEIEAFLMKAGFRKQHIDEAMKYVLTFNGILEWLIFYVPEDDLPELFRKSKQHSLTEVKITKNIKYENNVKLLRSIGFNIDDIEMALQESNDELILTIKLTQQMVPPEIHYAEESNEDPEEVWQNECGSIVSMGYKLTYDSKVADFKDKLHVKFVRSDNYPFDLVGIQILDDLPIYIKVSILKKIISHLYTNKYIGMEYIFTIIDFIQENHQSLISDPGPLITKEFTHRAATADTTKNSSRATRVQRVDAEKSKLHYLQRTSLPEYAKLIKDRSKLPAWQKQEDILEIVRNNQIVLITGETGSGKSTQIVQFILDDLNKQAKYDTKIMVTQPRRIAAIGLADRISHERYDKVGSEIGYMVRGDLKVSPLTRITFATTGVLLRLLQGSSTYLSSLSHIVIDEVHERSVDSDFLLIILKQYLPKFPHLKVILMSATLEREKFDAFFGKSLPSTHISGRTFPITDIYLDTILEDLDYEMELNDQIIKPSADAKFFQYGNINYDLIVKLVEHICVDISGSILIFMSGVYEINQLKKSLDKLQDIIALPLHSGLSSQEQSKVFNFFKKTKVIISTNIAETSITIPDCTVVIDLGRVKSVEYNSHTNTSKLVESWCSKAEVMQRRGRSGRIQPGTCFHVYTEDTLQSMQPQPIPEIKRTNLDNLALIIKAMGIHNIKKFLLSGIDPPNSLTIDKSELNLQKIGALNDEGKLTNLGRYMSLIPSDLSSSKLLVLATLFGCVENSVIVAAIKSIGSPFLKGIEYRDACKNLLSKYSNGNGDLIGMMNILKAYKKSSNRLKFIKDNHLSYLTLKEIFSTISQYEGILREQFPQPKDQNDSTRILKAVITAAYYPSVARVVYPDTKYFQSSKGSVEVNPDERLIRYFVESNNESKRVFVHPLSSFFNKSAASAESAEEYRDDMTPVVQALHLKPPFVVYGSSHETTKHFISEITPSNAVSILLFGGKINYNMVSGDMPGIVVDGWMTIRTWCKNAVLVKQLRQLVDQIIDDKLRGESSKEDETVLAVVQQLVEAF